MVSPSAEPRWPASADHVSGVLPFLQGMFKMVVEIPRQRPARPPPAALITGEQSKLRSFIGLPPLKPGTIRCAVMLVAPKRPLNPATRNLLHTAVTRSTGLALDRSCR
jgi:hypothetical protein